VALLIGVPSKEQILLLSPFEPLGLDRIELVTCALQAERASAELASAVVCGFDTESKPTFHKGQLSDGPHVLQLATREKAWVVQLHDADCRAIAARWLARLDMTKVGFGLRDDCKRIARKLGVEPAGVLDLNAEFRKRGFRKEVGAVGAVAALLNQRFVKSKKVSTSNWAKARLSGAQLVYAANDAYVAVRVYDALFSSAGGGRP
jgi:ribonuclease D